MIINITEHIRVEHTAIDNNGATYKRIMSGVHPLWLVKVGFNGWANADDERSKQLEKKYKSFEKKDKIIKSER